MQANSETFSKMCFSFEIGRLSESRPHTHTHTHIHSHSHSHTHTHTHTLRHLLDENGGDSCENCRPQCTPPNQNGGGTQNEPRGLGNGYQPKRRRILEPLPIQKREENFGAAPIPHAIHYSGGRTFSSSPLTP